MSSADEPQQQPLQAFQQGDDEGKMESGSGQGAPQNATTTSPKMSVPRITQTPVPTRSSARTSHACDPCRRRRSKCDGQIPECGRCRKFHLECWYGDGKRERQRKENQGLAAKASLYEGLLKESLRYYDPARRQAIQSATMRVSSLGLMSNDLDKEVTSENELKNETVLRIPKEESVSEATSWFSHSHNRTPEDLPSPFRVEGFLGKASVVGWLEDAGEKLLKEEHTPSSRRSSAFDTASFKSGDMRATLDESNQVILGNATYYRNDLELSSMNELSERVNGMELPNKETTDALLECYFQSLHLVYPVVLKPVFMDQYNTFFESSQLPEHGHTWLAMLNLMLAIGIVGMQAIEPHYSSAENQHIIYYMRARLLHPDPTTMVAFPTLEHIQLSFLFGVYFTATCQINRAFHVVGSSLRFAQSLDLHLLNSRARTTDSRRELETRVWHSICTLDLFLSFVSGRPAASNHHTASARLPMPIEADVALQPTEPPDLSSSPRSEMEPASSIFILQCSVLLNEILADTMRLLYSASTVKLTWTELQSHILHLNSRLESWRSQIPESYNFDLYPEGGSSSLPERMYLVLRYFSISMMINRPCLREPNPNFHQSAVHDQPKASTAGGGNSAASIGDDGTGAALCLASARAIIRLFPTDPDIIWLFQSTPWWCVLHYIVQAGVILVLDILYNAPHATDALSDIVADAQKVLRWLAMLAETGIAARGAWVALSRLLRLSLSRIGEDPAVLEPFMPAGERPQRDYVMPDVQ